MVVSSLSGVVPLGTICLVAIVTSMSIHSLLMAPVTYTQEKARASANGIQAAMLSCQLKGRTMLSKHSQLTLMETFLPEDGSRILVARTDPILLNGCRRSCSGFEEVLRFGQHDGASVRMTDDNHFCGVNNTDALIKNNSSSGDR